jgi:predicted Zn-dependent protease
MQARRLQLIVDRLAEQIEHLPRLPEHRKHIPWKVVVVADNSPNAAAAPNGMIVVNTGVLCRLDRCQHWCALRA